MIHDIEAQVLIIGGGAAACSAAIEAAKFGVSTVLVDKGRLGRSGSSPASGGTGDATLKGEYGPAFIKDTLKGGEGINNKKLLKIFVTELDGCARLLENIGLPVSKQSDGSYRMARGFGESIWRPVLYVNNKGYGLMECLRKEVLHRNVRTLENIMMIHVFTAANEVIGAAGIDRSTGELYIFRTNSIVVAAGGATGLFRYASANFKTTGDAYRLLYDAGVKLANMEFHEFTLIPKAGGTPISSGGINWSTHHGLFFNKKKERFMLRYDPELKEKASRGMLARAVYREIKAGRGPIMIDLSRVTSHEWEKRENEEGKTHLLWKLKRYGIDYRKESFEWVPAVHTSLGGAVINEKAETCISGLFAAGESAGHGGIFGADRIGKALSACFVFGKIAGHYASAKVFKKKKLPLKQDIIKKFCRKLERLQRMPDPAKPASIRRAFNNLRDLSWHSLSVERNKASLTEALTALQDIQKAPYLIKTPRDVTNYLELENLILTGKLLAKAALLRTESRGQHCREDCPGQDPKWKKLILHQYIQGEETVQFKRL